MKGIVVTENTTKRNAMKLNLKITLCLICLLCLGSIRAQMQKQWIVDGQLRNFGYDLGFGYQQGLKDQSQKRGYGLRIGSLNSPKEIYVINNTLPGSQPFKIDKVNYAWVLRPYVSVHHDLTQRKSRNEVGMSLFGSAQLPVAYSWPIYIWLYEGNSPFDGYSDVQYNPEIHDSRLIGGTASFTRGFGKGSFTPGVGISGGISLEWGSYRSMSNVLSFGVMTDAFVQKIQIMHTTENNAFIFPMLFVNFAFGFGK